MMGHTVLYLKNTNLIDVVTGEIALSNILIENGWISKVEKVEDCEGNISSGAEIIDVNGKWVLPGLIDMHVHIKEGFAPVFTASGVTTVRNTGGNVIELKSLIEAPPGAATPRVISADRIIDGPPGLWGETSQWNINIDNAEDARKEVRRQVDAGADLIKVYCWLSKEMMEVVVDEAKKKNREVSCDLVYSKDVTAIDAARMGVRWNEHASGIVQDIYPEWTMQADDTVWDTIDWDNPDKARIEKVCKVLLENNVIICPTMVLLDQANLLENYWFPDNKVMEKVKENVGLIQQWERILGYPMKSLGIQHIMNKTIAKIYFDLGGMVVAGTDTPAGIFTLPGMALHRELELFVQAGFKEIDAIRAATIVAAEALKCPELGVIKEGAIADIVILNKNPLEDIRNTKEIDFLIKGGTAYTQDELLEQVPSEETVMKNVQAFIESFEVNV
ncbi:amidohydrolase family protein [Psychrobacillus sp.]|uniref:amidohydrolase family protein n=1 Tax=Psychrobacillus sp. TaxID=1871623 RepID=UPI0028BD7829|nr:amidohydrolase family protein [Psychrobacillus sp.]